MTTKQYGELTKKASPNSKVIPNCLNAFWVGGSVCLLGQLLMVLYTEAGFSQTETRMAVSVTLILLSVLATGFGFYEKFASLGHAGALIPITGFANAMSSPAIEFKTEGHVTGLAAKMFSIAGPVLVYGLSAGFVYGLVLCLFQLI